MKYFIQIWIIFLFLQCTGNLTVEPFEQPNGGRWGSTRPISGFVGGTLTASNLPYHATTLILLEGEQLVIEPGVTIAFEDTASFIIRGSLIAHGTSDDPILFTSFHDRWAGIVFENVPDQDSSQLKFCVVENVVIDESVSQRLSAVEIYQSNLMLQNCLIQNNNSETGGGLYGYHSKATIQNTVFRNNTAHSSGGAIYFFRSDARMINNTFFQNHCSGFGGSVVASEADSVEIQNTIFDENFCSTGNVTIDIVDSADGYFVEQYNYLQVEFSSPGFVSVDDLHLGFGSLCINTGNPDPIFNDWDGSRNDKGAYGGPRGDW